MGETYEFADCVVDEERYEVRRSGETVHVEPQVFDVIVHLIRNRGHVVSKHELLDAVWGDRFVSESALATRINAARRALGDDGTRQAVIKTAFGRGYEFVAELTSGMPSMPSTPPGSAPVAPVGHDVVRVVEAGGGDRLAYAVSGSGPPLVKAANWMTHIEF
ncbi:MAG: transcriptional regulator, partial [Actinomycetota bacterium]